MSSWLLSDSPLSDTGRAFRRLWAQRWQTTHQGWLTDRPTTAAYDHRHAYPEFRNPLGFDESREANRAFHCDVVRRLAIGESDLWLVTLDVTSIWHEDGTRHEWRDDEHNSVEMFGRDKWLDMILDFDDFEETNGEDYGVAHVFVSRVTVDDPRLEALWAETASGEQVLVTNAGLDWIARPAAECVGVAAFDPAILDKLRAAEQASLERWGIAAHRASGGPRRGGRSHRDPQRRLARPGRRDHDRPAVPVLGRRRDPHRVRASRRPRRHRLDPPEDVRPGC